MQFSKLGAKQLVVHFKSLNTVLVCEAKPMKEVVSSLSGKNFKIQVDVGPNPDIFVLNSDGKYIGYRVSNYPEFCQIVRQSFELSHTDISITEIHLDSEADEALKNFVKQPALEGTIAEMRSICKSVMDTLNYRELTDGYLIRYGKYAVRLPDMDCGLKLAYVNGFLSGGLHPVYYITPETMIDLVTGKVLHFEPVKYTPDLDEPLIEYVSHSARICPRDGLDLITYRNLMQVLPELYTTGWQEFKEGLQNWFNGVTV